MHSLVTMTGRLSTTVSGLERGGDWRLPVHVYMPPSVIFKGLNVRVDIPSDDVTMMSFPVITSPSKPVHTAWGTPVSPDMTSLILQINEYTSPAVAVPLTEVAIEIAPSGTVYMHGKKDENYQKLKEPGTNFDGFILKLRYWTHPPTRPMLRGAT